MFDSASRLSESLAGLVHPYLMFRSNHLRFLIFAAVAAVAALLVLLANIPEKPVTQDQAANIRSIDLLLDIEQYNDYDYSFSMAIPAGWRKIVSADLDDGIEDLEPGYAIGFESPDQGNDDRFADYILVEILPGTESGLFDFDPENRKQVQIDGHTAWFDTVYVNNASDGATEVDLTIYQAELQRVGYTVGFYAIGEPDRAGLMAAAFELLMRTFEFQMPPYSVS